MIAPLKEYACETTCESETLQRARQAVARTLLSENSNRMTAPHALPGWVAWALTGWMVVTAAVYLTSLIDNQR